MIEEFLDIVDENNELTGKSMPRSKVHAKGLWHRTVHISVFRKKENQLEFLVHLRSKFKDFHANQWGTSVGGHIKSGDSFEESVASELQEEIGLKVDFAKLLGGYWRKRDKNPNREFTKNYALEFDGDLADLTFNDGEVQEAKWMNVAEIQNSLQKNPEIWAGTGAGLVDMLNFLKENHEI